MQTKTSKLPKRKVSIARGLAIALLISDWEPKAQIQTTKQLIRRWPRWIASLVDRVHEAFPDGLEISPELEAVDRLEKFISVDREFRLAVKVANLKQVDSNRVLMGRPMVSLAWKVPDLPNFLDLADWLEVSRRELNWLANLATGSFDLRYKRSSHYVVSAIGKRSKGIRLIESPKSLMKRVQRKINEEILNKVPPHVSAHGFCRGRSVLTFAKPHVGKLFCLKVDLKDFFPSIKFGRVSGLFKTMGFSREARYYLAALCTNGLDEDALFRATGTPGSISTETTRLYMPRHLPQGAPTSPAIANLIAFNLDRRLAGLAKSAKATYTRYADDLLFSGDEEFARSAKRFVTSLGAIAIEEGFEVNFRKTRHMRSSQRQMATGVVLNERLNVSRKEFDRLKAILNNCVRLGPLEQNRDEVPDFRAHLAGRIQWVQQLNPSRGKRLQSLFEAIQW